MKITNASTAYAKAYLNVFGDGLPRDSVVAIEQAGLFLQEHRRALFLLKVPVMDEAVKRKGIKELSNRFGLPSSIEQLFELLLNRRCASLLADVFLAIVREYNKRNHHEKVVVSSSQALSDEQRKKIIAFADKRFPGSKEYEFKLDASLIAGIKIMSNTMVWESSIDNYLRECTQAQIW
jgi:F0F1-type ATP synthase delta subunit